MRIRRGYTLIELLVVLAVLGLLASMAMPLAGITIQREKERELRRALWEIRDALDAYRRARDDGAVVGLPGSAPYPPDLQALLTPSPDARTDRQRAPLRFLRAIPRDPFADPALSAGASWGLRSYESEPDKPQPGADVYDVYSTSDKVGARWRSVASMVNAMHPTPGRGFTVIELLVVLAAIALLLSVAAPRYLRHLDTARETVLKEDLFQLRDAIDKFHADQSRYPATLDELVTRRYLRAVPVDPLTDRTDSWTLVAAPGSTGATGDVRSGAKGVARDGSAYAGW